MKNKQTLTNELIISIQELFHEVNLEMLIDYLSDRMDNLLFMDDEGNFMLTKNEMKANMFISCTLLKQLTKAYSSLEKYETFNQENNIR